MNNQEKIAQMTLEEKASLMSGANFWNTKSIDRLKIPSIMLTDGPHGLRKQGGKADHLGLNKSIPATCFPTAATLANSWDRELLEEVGQCLGREAAREEVSVLLGPGLNIKRNPLCGRNFEYFSEDPFLTGKLAASMIQGIQSAGISACPKHFAVNSQETRRMIVDELVDERALHELYLEGFRYAVEEGKPKTVMSSYNKVNGTYANENHYLLQTVLRDQWGFQGLVVTDWGGNNDRISGLKAGNALEMPSTNGMTDQEIIKGIETNQVSEKLLDTRVNELLNLIDQTKEKNQDLKYDHHQKAIEAATRSMVLLKNEEEILPLKDQKICIIGDFAKTPRYQGAGSSLIVPTQVDNLLDALSDSSLNLIGYEKGFHRLGKKSQRLIDKACHLALKSDIVLLFLGLDEGSEAEGVDRDHMGISQNQRLLLDHLKEVNPNIVLLLAGGSPVELPFVDDVKAILHSYLPGQGGGKAIARILTGQYNPSGKLAETYPIKYEDVASSDYYPGVTLTSEHREGIYIGYRYYDSIQKGVRFPFGHGLSYTSFEYSHLSITQNTLTFSLENTGSVAGEEIVQAYVRPLNRKVFSAEKELKGFQKVFLQAGEKKMVTIELDDHAYSFYDIKKKIWVQAGGLYEILVGASSRDIRLKKQTSIIADYQSPYLDVDTEKYDLKDIGSLTSSDFEKIYGSTLASANWDVKKVLDENDILEQAKYGGVFGKVLYGGIILVRKFLKIIGKPILSNNITFALEMPFRSVARMSGGRMNMKMLQGLLLMVNKHFFKGLYTLIKWTFKGEE